MKKYSLYSFIIGVLSFIVIRLIAAYIETRFDYSEAGLFVALVVLIITFVILILGVLMNQPKDDSVMLFKNNTRKRKEMFFGLIVCVFISGLVYFYVGYQSILVIAFVTLVLCYSILVIRQNDGIYGDAIYIQGIKIQMKYIVKFYVEKDKIYIELKRKIMFINLPQMRLVRCSKSSVMEFAKILSEFSA